MTKRQEEDERSYALQEVIMNNIELARSVLSTFSSSVLPSGYIAF